LEAIVGLARTAPPAIQAYALTRVAMRIQFNRKWRSELLTEAFDLAALSPEPYPMRLIPGLKQSSSLTMRARRYTLGFDRLSLRMNALQFMGFEMEGSIFDHVPRPQPKPAACSDALVPDVSPYYRSLILLSHVVQLADRRKGLDVAFYESLLLSMRSPVEVIPAAHMLSGISLSAANSARLLNRFATALSTIHGDDRSFSSTLYALPDEMARLSDTMSARGVDTTAFRKAMREYLVRHFRSRRCSDTAADTVLTARVASAFGLDPEDLRPLDVGDGPDLGADGEPAHLIELREMWRKLQFEGLTRPTPEGRAARFEQFASKLDDWPAGTDEPDEVFYPVKQAFFETALITSRGDEQVELLKRYVAFLNSYPNKPEMQPESFAAAQCLSRILPVVPDGFRQTLLDSLERSRNPMLSLFVQLERRR
jgi:hypothetical protein